MEEGEGYVYLENTAIFLKHDCKETWIYIKDISCKVFFNTEYCKWKMSIVFWMFVIRIGNMHINNISRQVL